MENEKSKSENINNQPKPGDDIQLEIETVVPSAHEKSVSDRSAEKSTTNENQSPEINKDEEEHEDRDDNEKLQENTPAGEDDQSDDTRDQIETVSP